MFRWHRTQAALLQSLVRALRALFLECNSMLGASYDRYYFGEPTQRGQGGEAYAKFTFRVSMPHRPGVLICAYLMGRTAPSAKELFYTDYLIKVTVF